MSRRAQQQVSRIAFRVRDDGVRILIDDRDLRDIVREVERPFARAEGHAGMEGQYRGLPPNVVFLPSRHLLGSPRAEYSWRKPSVMDCPCGESLCWPLLVRVTLGPRRVRWDGFEQPFRRRGDERGWWRYDRMPAFTFARDQYEAALRGPASTRAR